ncbi:MAG: hypothetical protein KAW52_00410 [candidate division Zixibacteria bacterium]|nr:hypothetical protein [candidate division Zixibacteria bacterium]
MSKLKYEIREGTDLKWGIYSTEYNIRIAEFYPNTEADRKQARERIQKPEVTEEWIEEKAKKLLAEYPVEISYGEMKKFIQNFIRSLVEEIHGKRQS